MIQMRIVETRVWLFVKMFFKRLSRRGSCLKLPKSCNKRLGFPSRHGIDSEARWVIISGSRLESGEGVHDGRAISPSTNFFILGLNLSRKASISSTIRHSLSDEQDGDESRGKVKEQIITRHSGAHLSKALSNDSLAL